MRLDMLFAATALFLMAHAYVMDHDDFDCEIMHDDEYDITKMEVTFKDEPRWGFEDVCFSRLHYSHIRAKRRCQTRSMLPKIFAGILATKIV
jgi:hypothetical protein